MTTKSLQEAKKVAGIKIKQENYIAIDIFRETEDGDREVIDSLDKD